MRSCPIARPLLLRARPAADRQDASVLSFARPTQGVRGVEAASYDVRTVAVGHVGAPLAVEIDALARSAAEPNPFHESWMLAAALEHLRTAPLELLCVRARSSTG
jgi:hypothetical protein